MGGWLSEDKKDAVVCPRLISLTTLHSEFYLCDIICCSQSPLLGTSSHSKKISKNLLNRRWAAIGLDSFQRKYLVACS